MPLPHRPRLRALFAGTAAAALVLGAVAPNLAFAAESTTASTPATALAAQAFPLAPTVDPRLSRVSGTVTVYVTLKGQAGAYFEAKAKFADRAQVGTLSAEEIAEQQRLAPAIIRRGNDLAAKFDAQVIYNTVNTVPGVAMRLDASAIKGLAADPQVESISLITPQKRTNKGADLDVKALSSWANTGESGEGVTIAVIDTGLDYTHADFGGPGTPEAYQEAEKSGTVESLAQIPARFYDAQKFVGGHDLAGDNYDADAALAQDQIPHPDGNPLDCAAGGHGSHVAGTAAGYGIGPNGKTFHGDYSALNENQLLSFKIGPGTAPKARLASFRVFGCEGTTSLTGKALDDVLNPAYYRDPAHMAKVVNLSLGASFGVDTSAEQPIMQKLHDAGVLLVISAGNEGNKYNVLGSPGAYKSALTVANSIGTYQTQVYDQAQADITPVAKRVVNGQRSRNFDFAHATPAQLSGAKVALAPANNAFGCQPFPAGTFAGGAWAWIKWSEGGEFPCSSTQRFNNVEAAGGKGVILESEVNIFDLGINGNTTIPGFQLTLDDTEKLRPLAQSGQLGIDLNLSTRGSAFAPTDKFDVLSASSSRGGHGSDGTIKPDIAAPGTSIGSVDAGSGNGIASMSGTSMAAPDISGLAALVYEHEGSQAIPEVVKSKLMNTSSNTLKNSDGTPAGPSRAGTGRANALAALATPVYASATEDPVGTSVVFGVIEAKDTPVQLTKSITVHNTSNKALRYSLALNPASEVPGASFSLRSKTVSVPARSDGKVDVTFTIADPKKLAKSITAGTDRIENGIARQYVAEAQARVTFSSPNQPDLNVVVQAAPKPVSELSAGSQLEFPAGETTIPLQFTGRGVDQGGEGEHYQSLVSPFTLGYSADNAPDEKLREVVKATTVKEAGVNTNFGYQPVPQGGMASPEPDANPLINFGIATFANLPVSDNGDFEIYVDTNADQQPDFAIVNSRLANTDLNVAATYDVRGENWELVQGSQYPLNTQSGEVDTNSFDSNVFTVPTSFKALGLDKDHPAFSYKVTSFTRYVSDNRSDNPTQLTDTDWISYDPAHPGVSFAGDGDGLIYTADTASTLQVSRAAEDAKALLLFHHNASGTRDQVLTLPDEPQASASASATASAGATARATASARATATANANAQSTPSGQAPTAGSGEALDGTSSGLTPPAASEEGSMPDTGAHAGLWLGALGLVLIGASLIAAHLVLSQGRHHG